MAHTELRNRWYRVADLPDALAHLRENLGIVISVYLPTPGSDWWVLIPARDETLDEKTTLLMAARNESHIFIGTIAAGDKGSMDAQGKEGVYLCAGDRLSISALPIERAIFKAEVAMDARIYNQIPHTPTATVWSVSHDGGDLRSYLPIELVPS